MSNVVIEKKTGKRISIEDITTRNPQRTLEILVESGRCVWEGQPIEVTPLDAVEILEMERERLIQERDEFEIEKKNWKDEVEAEKLRLEEVKKSFK